MSTGSATKEGYLYHEPAFKVGGKKLHRNDNHMRLKKLLDSQDFRNRNVLDLGCNVGFFSIKLAMYGARVTGVDSDPLALAIARQQSEDNMIENVTFVEPDMDRRYTKGKDILLALSVLPWIYETEEKVNDYLKKLFSIPIAYVEIPYPPDGRAHVPGVTDDDSAKKYLEKWYPIVNKISVSDDDTDGVVRKRTVWKCMKTREVDTTFAYGSQAEVNIGHRHVCKRGREGKQWDADKEASFLKKVEEYGISPKVISCNSGELVMSKIIGRPLTTCPITLERVTSELRNIVNVLERSGISHNDIRPSNLIVGHDNNLYLIDYGWATGIAGKKPEGVNPIFGTDDVEACKKIVEAYKKWIQ